MNIQLSSTLVEHIVVILNAWIACIDPSHDRRIRAKDPLGVMCDLEWSLALTLRTQGVEVEEKGVIETALGLVIPALEVSQVADEYRDELESFRRWQMYLQSDGVVAGPPI